MIKGNPFKVIKAFFVKHPESIGETYLEHLMFASMSGARLVFAGVACIIHSVFPFMFESTASQTIQHLSGQMDRRKNKPV